MGPHRVPSLILLTAFLAVGTYPALFDRAERRLEDDALPVAPGQLAIRDLSLLDGVMARLAEAMGLQVANYDTATVG